MVSTRQNDTQSSHSRVGGVFSQNKLNKIPNKESKRLKNPRSIIGFVFLFSVSSLVAFIVHNADFSTYLKDPLFTGLLWGSFTVLIASTTVSFIRGLFAYLRPTSRVSDYFEITNDAIEGLFQRLDYLEANLRLVKHKEISENEKDEILSDIQLKLESDALESYLQKLEELAAIRIKNDNIEQRFEGIINRLGNEIQDLAKRGNLNLIIGIVITMVGLIALSYSVFNLPTTYTPEELLAYFIPRVSLVFLIEVFAYFFLRLYKQSLSEIKYFQNETTNIEAKHLAIHIASRTNDPALLNRVVDELVKTERNFILGKDQTTVELERDRISRSSNNEILAILKDLLKTK